MSAATYDQAAIRILLDRTLTSAQQQAALAELSREASRRVGGQADPCQGCGCNIYEDHDGDVVCSDCGLPHGADTEDE